MKLDSLPAACLSEGPLTCGVIEKSSDTYPPWGTYPPPLGWLTNLVRHLPTSIPGGPFTHPWE